MNELLKRVSGPFMALPPLRRWAVVGVVLLSFAGFGVLITMSNRIDYKPLFANLGSDDAGEITKKLKEQKVPYRIASDGKAILVPADKVYDLRLTLASEGLPQGGGVGFEIFDRKNFGMTEFVQKLNYQRALQGELTRTIMQLTEVEKARVHLVIPEKSLFKENEKPPTASVVLQLKSGRMVRDSSVQGIVHLVASSVEGMDPEQVTVLDSRGKVLSRTGPSDAAGKLTATMMETQRNYEKNVEERLQTLLDKAVGSGKSVARVTAVLDFKQVERVEERYDPNSAVLRSQQKSEQKDPTPAVPAAGTPGVQTNTVKGTANAPAPPPPPVIPPVAGTKNDETSNYEVSRSSAKIVEPIGALSKLSVAILVDGKYEPVAPVKKGGPLKPKYVPRNADELQKIESLVKSAVGFSGDRGDQLTVVNVPFQDSGDDALTDTVNWWERPFFMDLLKNGLLGLGFIALLLLVVRPLLKTVLAPATQGARRAVQPLPLDGEQQGQLPGPQAQLPRLGLKSVSQLELLETVKQEPYQAAQILQTWLRQSD